MDYIRPISCDVHENGRLTTIQYRFAILRKYAQKLDVPPPTIRNVKEWGIELCHFHTDIVNEEISSWLLIFLK